MSHNQRLIDRQLDLIERMLIRCIEEDKAARKERRAQLRALKEKLNLPNKGSAESNSSDGEPKH
jgi:hypothetical protein